MLQIISFARRRNQSDTVQLSLIEVFQKRRTVAKLRTREDSQIFDVCTLFLNGRLLHIIVIIKAGTLRDFQCTVRGWYSTCPGITQSAKVQLEHLSNVNEGIILRGSNVPIKDYPKPDNTGLTKN